ncbi:MAG: acyl-CoA dehydrogenase family protein [Aquincola sp.]|nr:acyl-CoA dehydrogenase family protein [Aquincola sp.]MDH4290247.1 acyl-CoA dehydrogenase family protein [Aquincola sp.]MDH5331344.1 acyl-CoA dehydrogenase family protein [Aquincola sp.]
MNFDFSDDQVALRDAVARWVERDFGFERRHALAKKGGATRDVFRELVDLGLAGLTVDPSHGGMGFGAVEAMVVMEELGRGLVNAPYAAACLVAPALLAGGDAAVTAPWLARIADGSALIVPALQEQGARYRHDAVATTAAQQAGGWALAGTKHLAPAGDEADAYIVPARMGPHAVAPIGLFIVERARCRVRAYPTADGARAASVTLAASPAQLVQSDALGAIERAADVGIAAACAEGVGAMDRLVAMTVEYMNTRKQFGVPIASFQALRHRMADVKMALELARSMSYYASLKLGEPAPQRRRALSQAKVQLGQSMRFVGQQCIQLHGGIGVTDECAASHYFKRLTMLEFAFGDTLHHVGEVSERMADTAGVFA